MEVKINREIRNDVVSVPFSGNGTVPPCAVWYGTDLICLDDPQAEKTLFDGTDLPEWLTFDSSQKAFYSKRIALILQADYNKLLEKLKIDKRE